MTLLMTLYVEKSLEFSGFPTLLLLLTLFRLGLNLASTRMILVRAEAGDIIHTFGAFIIGNNLIAGLVIFSLLTVINFVVVTKGAGRIAEVSARFTLEALPGKQMSIENDVASGLLTQQDAKKAREKAMAEADFYGAMDGAAKFVRGDAIAGIIMIFLNLLGGFLIGIFVKGLSIKACLLTYTHLTVGEGLVSQLPALLVSVGAGIMVTRASSGSIGKTLSKEITQFPKVLMISACLLGLLSLVPGMPFLLMGTLSFLLFFYSRTIIKLRKKGETKTSKEQPLESVEEILKIHPIEVQLGSQLLSYAEHFLQSIQNLRVEVGTQWGIILPSLHISEGKDLPHKAFALRIRQTLVETGRVDSKESLVIQVKEALSYHLHELLTRQEMALLLQQAKKVDAAVIDELIPDKMKPGQLLKILQNLLKERFSIRDLPSILEVIADKMPASGLMDLDKLTEEIRKSFSKSYLEQLAGEKKQLHAITLDPKVEQFLISASQKTEGGRLILPPTTARHILSSFREFAENGREKGFFPVVITQPHSRRVIRQLIEKELPKISVLSFSELHKDFQIVPVGTISTEVLSIRKEEE